MSMRFRSYAALLLGVMTLSACDSLPDWMRSADEEKPKLEGDRVAVLMQDVTLVPDSGLEAVPIELSTPEYVREWPQHSGNYSGYAMNIKLDAALQQQTTTSIGNGEAYKHGVVAPPVVAMNTVFVMDAVGAISAHVMDDIDTRRWLSDGVANAEEEPMLGGGLAYDGGILYAVSGHGLVAAFDSGSGRQLWRQDIRIPVRAAPLVAGGKVFVVTADSKTFALDVATGDIVWEDQALAEGASFLANAAPVFNQGLLAIPYPSAELKVVTADEGREIWADVLAMTKRNIAASHFSGIGASPVIIDNAIYAVSTAGVLAAYRLDNGLRVWEQPISSANRPWVSGNTMYVLTTSAQLVALNRIDGRIYWVSALPVYEDDDSKKPAYSWSGPVLSGETLYIAGAHGVMKRVNALSGEVLEDMDIPDGVHSSPVIVNNTLYLVSKSATLVAIH